MLHNIDFSISNCGALILFFFLQKLTLSPKGRNGIKRFFIYCYPTGSRPGLAKEKIGKAINTEMWAAKPVLRPN